MAYVTQADLSNLIPAEFIVEALDDDGDGTADAGAWDGVAEEAGQEIDSYLEQRYALPLSEPYPARVIQAAKIFACEILYKRRGIHGDKNPFSARAERHRKALANIASGDAALKVGSEPVEPSISIITEPAGTVPRNRLNG